MTDDKFNKDGMPIGPLDLPNIHYRGDLANHVLPLWEKAGIGYDCYSVGSGGTMMMLADPSRSRRPSTSPWSPGCSWSAGSTILAPMIRRSPGYRRGVAPIWSATAPGSNNDLGDQPGCEDKARRSGRSASIRLGCICSLCWRAAQCRKAH